MLDRRAPPELLLHLDPRRLPDGLGGPADIREIDAQLAERYSGLEPNSLWLAWVRATRKRQLTDLKQRVDHGPVRSGAL